VTHGFAENFDWSKGQWQVRALTKQALRAMTELIRQRRVLRFRRRWVAALELPSDIVPIDSIPRPLEGAMWNWNVSTAELRDSTSLTEGVKWPHIPAQMELLTAFAARKLLANDGFDGVHTNF